jgi:hypothetical protein
MVYAMSRPAVATNLFCGRGKVGKTSFLTHMVAAVLRGESFLSTPTVQGACVWLNFETTQRLLLHKLEELGLVGHKLPLHVWSGFRQQFSLEQCAEAVNAAGAAVVVIDSFGAYSGLTESQMNDDGAVRAALMPIVEAARKSQAAWVLIHHMNKSKGPTEDQVKGNTALVEIADVIPALKWHGGAESTQRKFTNVLSRLSDDGPRELILDYDKTARSYAVLGTPAAVQAQEYGAAVLKVMSPEPRTRAEVAALVELSPGVVNRTLEALAERGEVTRSGKGKANNPYLYHLPAVRRVA